MKTSRRAGIGFAIGLVLTAMGFAAANLGHGTYALMLANVPLLGLGATIGLVIALLAAPFVWLFYFIFIPKIRTTILRTSIVAVIALLHYATLFWGASHDYSFDRALQVAFAGVLLYVLTLGAPLDISAWLQLRWLDGKTRNFEINRNARTI